MPHGTGTGTCSSAYLPLTSHFATPPPYLLQYPLPGGGESEFIVSNTDGMEAKVLRQLTRALQPLLTHVRVDWGSLKPLLKFPSAPAAAGPLYSGSRAVLFAVLDHGKGVWVGRHTSITLPCVHFHTLWH